LSAGTGAFCSGDETPYKAVDALVLVGVLTFVDLLNFAG
jgi:hypothetical protein